MASVELNHVGKRYGAGGYAVKDFNLTIEDKEFIVFVGPSGCGKSTTLRMIAGLEEISEGTISIDGRVINQIAPKDRDIAMVFQNYALYPHMSVRDNMSFGLKLRKMARAQREKKVQEAAQILGLTGYLDRKPSQLSGGERQRVALGRAIVRNPQVFLMDEPLSNLDAKLRVQMRAEISKLHTQLSTTFIYVTHDQMEAMTMASRIVVMKDGLIQQVASPFEVYHHPANLFVASFIGSLQINLFEGRLKLLADTPLIEIAEIEFPLPQYYKKPLLEKGCEGKTVTLGIRPEHVQLAHDAQSSVPAQVQVAELLGSETYVHLSSKMGPLTVKAGGDLDVKPKQCLQVRFDMRRAHLFDLESGQSLLPNSGDLLVRARDTDAADEIVLEEEKK